MPPRSERIAAMVRSELAKDPQITNDVLLKKAKAIDPSVRRLSPRQFHATYRLPVVRGTKTAANTAAKAAAKAAAPPPKATPAAGAPAPASPAPAPTPTPTPAPSPAPAAVSPAPQASHAASGHRSTSTAVARPNAAEREAVRQILQLVAREALATEDRGSFIRLLDSLDERSSVILGIFGRA